MEGTWKMTWKPLCFSGINATGPDHQSLDANALSNTSTTTSISVCRGRGVIVMTCEMNLQFKCRWRLGGLGCIGGIDA